MPEMKVEKSIEVKAPAERIWSLMVKIESWPDFIPVVRSAKLVSGEPMARGSKMRFTPELGLIKVPLTVTIVESDPPRRLAWGGGGPGVSAVHSFDLVEKDGKTTIISKESFTGFGVVFLRLAVSQKDLENLHVKWIEGLKQEAERQP